MPSVVVTGHEYLLRAQEFEARGPFKYRLLAEGDSWMDKSSLVVPSLPAFLAHEMDQRGESVMIINLALIGDTFRHITDVMRGEFMWWLKQFTYDGILLSAGGNDFIDAAVDPGPGAGLLLDMAGQPWPANGYDCVNQAGRSALIDQYLDPSFEQFYQAIRADAKNALTPIFLNSYDTPVARNAPAIPGFGPWLYTAYNKNHIDASLWPSLTAGIFADVAAVIQGWAQQRQGVSVVPTTGLLTPADPDATGSSGDWANEIHPNASGWAREARVWADTLQAHLA